MSGALRKAGYLRALFYGIPMGIIFIITGIISLFSPPSDHLDMKNLKSRNFEIKIEDYVNSKPRYYVVLGSVKYMPNDRIGNNEVTKFLNENDLDTMKYAKVYYYGSNYIGQLEIDDEVVIQYKKSYFSFHFFFWIGLILVVTGVLYVFRFPHDLFGGENREEGLKKREEFLKNLYDKMR